ncbi:MAG: lipid-A-disaccharide synthase [Thermodesulfobacteriota bacterium]
MTDANRKKMLIVTGETSGDHHGAGVVAALKKIDPAVAVYGVGGDALAGEGVELIRHSKDLAVVGILEVLANFSTIWNAYSAVKKIIRERPPDLVLLIDYPDFNLAVARYAKKYRIPVLYYISPQIWAWRQGRARKIARIVDRMAVIFPFEVPFYQRVGLDVRFVGHPLRDRIPAQMDREAARQRLGFETESPIIGLLPGSRKGEIDRMLPLILDAAVLIRREMSGAGFILPLAPGLDAEAVENHIRRRKIPVRVVTDQFYQAVGFCDLALAVSGTATLETALLEKPMVILYLVSPLTYMIGSMLVKVDHIGIANIVAGKKVVPELIQQHATPARIAAEALKILKDPERMHAVAQELSQIKEKLGEPGAAKRVAAMAWEMMTG